MKREFKVTLVERKLTERTFVVTDDSVGPNGNDKGYKSLSEYLKKTRQIGPEDYIKKIHSVSNSEKPCICCGTNTDKQQLFDNLSRVTTWIDGIKQLTTEQYHLCDKCLQEYLVKCFNRGVASCVVDKNSMVILANTFGTLMNIRVSVFRKG